MRKIFNWTFAAPILSLLLIASGLIGSGAFFYLLAALFLVGSIMAAVHHAEVVAYKVGEPFGTIILAVSITILETAIIISLMLAGGEGAEFYARDTLFSAVMLILNGILGVSILVGALKFKEQTFEIKSVTIALVALFSIIVLTLILPNYTTSVAGPFYSKPQLLFVTIACLVIYFSFLRAQTIRHREYFLSPAEEGSQEENPDHLISKKEAITSLVLLLACLGAVILLAKKLSPVIEETIVGAGLPNALVGLLISTVILLPEGISAARSASRNKFQGSINLSLGSAIASIGLSIPTVAILCVILDIPLILGLDPKSMVLLGLSLFTVMLSLIKGKTNLTYGTVLLVNLMAYIFTIVYK